MRCPHFVQSVCQYLHAAGRTSPAAKRRLIKGRARLGVNALERRNLLSGVWTQVADLSGNGIPPIEHEMLLSDGTVLLQAGYDSPTSLYYLLKPNGAGNYAYPTITRVASSNVAPCFTGRLSSGMAASSSLAASTAAMTSRQRRTKRTRGRFTIR